MDRLAVGDRLAVDPDLAGATARIRDGNLGRGRFEARRQRGDALPSVAGRRQQSILGAVRGERVGQPLALARGHTRRFEPVRQLAQLRAKHVRLAFALCDGERLYDLVAFLARGLRAAVLLFGETLRQLGELRRLAHLLPPPASKGRRSSP